MLFNHLFRSRKPRPPVKPFTLPSRWNATILRLEALDERVVPSFSEPTIYPVGPGAISLVSADFTGDGVLDLATNGGVLVGNGDGSFQPARLSPMPGGSLLAGDVDGDGKADLIVTTVTLSENTLNVLISNGDGSFRPAQPVPLPPLTPPDYTGEPLTQSIANTAVGDFNADGLLDLVVTGTTHQAVMAGGAYGYYYDDLVSTYANVLIGTGLGTFEHSATHYLGGDLPASLPYEYVFGPDVGDFNGDGNLDFLASTVTDQMFTSDSSSLSAWLGNGDGTFQLGISGYSGGGRFVQRAVADFNQDGKTDVLTGGEAVEEDGTRTIALGTSDVTFTLMDLFDMGGDEYAVVGEESGDVNGDGILDLLFVKDDLYIGNGWSDILLGNGDGTFTAPVLYSLGSYDYASPTLADFDGDGFADLAAVDRNVGVIVQMNTGDSSPPPPGLQITGASVIEGNSGTTAMTFTVSLTHAATGPVTVQYAMADGSAAAGSDYRAASGTLTIPAGQTTGTITVLVNGDRLPEANETFAVNLSAPTNATIVDGQGGGTIVDDEPRISISDVTKTEGGRNKRTSFIFTVTLSAAYDQPVTVSFKTTDGTATTSDNDYVAQTGTITFNPGETSKTIKITVKGDKKKESNEVFYLDLFGNSSNSLFTKNRGVGVILNDD